MKKKKIILISIVAIIIIIITAIILVNKINNNKNYELEKISNYNYFVLKQNNKYGVINVNGDKILEANYNNIIIPNPEKSVFICQAENDTKVLNEKGEEILNQYTKVTPIRLKNTASDLMYEKSVLEYEKDGKYGLINFAGKQIVNAKYDSIEALPYKEGELIVKSNDKYGIININGAEIVKCKYDKISIDNYYTQDSKYKLAGYIVAVKTDEGYRYGYINSNGKILIETIYNDISRITDIKDEKNIYLLAAKNGQYGLIKNNQLLTTNEYQSMEYNSNINLIVVEKSKMYGIIDIQGKEIIPIQYNQIDINGMYIYVTNTQGTEVYDSNGNATNMDVNTAKIPTENENYIISINNENNTTKYGVINKEGKKIIEEKYSYIEYLFENYFIASNENGKLGIIDENNNEKLELKYDAVQKISNKNIVQATLANESITQLYSNKLQKVLEMKNANIDKNNDYIKVYNESKREYLDNNGNKLLNKDIYKDNKLLAKEENGKYGFADENGKITIECKYDNVTEFNKYGFAGIKQNGKWGVIDSSGNIVKEPTYEINGQLEPEFIGQYYKVTYGFGEFYYTDEK